MAPLKGALVGCGFFSTNHLNAWQDLAGEGDAQIVALCDRDSGRLAEAAGRFGIERTYNDAAEMFAREPLDFVDVTTTVPSHRALVELAAAHRVPVICQKPMAANLDDARAMVDACAGVGVPFMVHENFRWQAPLRAVREALDSGVIGAPFWARVSFRTAYDVYSGQPYLAEGERFILEDIGVHVLDVARFLLGEADRVAATTRRVNPRIRGEDVATVLLHHGEGASSVVDCSYSTRTQKDAFPETLIEIDGSEGSIRLTPGYVLTVTGKDGSQTRSTEPPLLPWAERPWHGVQDSVLQTQRHWVDCLRNGREPDTSGRDNLQTLLLVEAAYASAEEGRTVRPDAL